RDRGLRRCHHKLRAVPNRRHRSAHAVAGADEGVRPSTNSTQTARNRENQRDECRSPEGARERSPGPALSEVEEASALARREKEFKPRTRERIKRYVRLMMKTVLSSISSASPWARRI